MKKVGETTRLFRYYLNQIPYDYTVEVTNRFKGLDLIECLKNYVWKEVHNTVQDVVIKTISKEKKCKKAKWLSEEALQIAEKRREAEGKGAKERYTHLNAEFQRIARRRKKAFPSDQCKEIEENNRMGKTRDLFNKQKSDRFRWRERSGSVCCQTKLGKRKCLNHLCEFTSLHETGVGILSLRLLRNRLPFFKHITLLVYLLFFLF